MVKSKWINDKTVENNIQAHVVCKSIIYGGQNTRFSGFTKNNVMTPPSNMTLQQIEKQNMGVELISAIDYLNNTVEKLSILDNIDSTNI